MGRSGNVVNAFKNIVNQMENSNMKSIAVVLPSRGMIMAQTIQYLEETRRKFPLTLYISHNLSIPDCFIKLTNQALKGDHDYIWFLEDDMIPPKKGLENMLKLLET